MRSPMSGRPELFYSAVSLLAGIVFVLITPPGSGPDEISHAARAIQVANGRILDLPEGDRFPDIFSMFGGPSDSVKDAGFRININSLTYIASRPLSCESRLGPLKYGARGYPPLPYVLPAMMYRLACMTDASFGFFFYGSRLLNLLLVTALIAVAIHLCPVSKWALVVIGLLPSVVFGAAVLSADGLTNGAAFLWLALVVRAATQSEILTSRSIAMLCGVGLVLALTKPGYQILLFAFLAVPPERFGGLRGWMSAGALTVALPCLVGATWLLMNAGLVPPRPGVDPSTNLHRLIAEPTYAVYLLCSTLSAYGDPIARGAIGVLGWMDVRLPGYAYTLWGGALGMSLLANQAPVKLRVSQRIILLAIAGSGVLMVAMSMYLIFTPADNKTIEGIQGRYLIPLLLTFAIAVSWNSRGWEHQKRLIVALIMVLCVLGSAAATTAVVVRYYVAPAKPVTAASFYEGKIIAGPDHTWYFVENGKRHHIPSRDWLAKSGKTTAIAVNDEEFAALPLVALECPAPRTLGSTELAALSTKYEGRAVRQPLTHCGRESGWFFVENGRRRWILDAAWLSRRGMSAADVLEIPSEDFMGIPEDPEVLR